MGVHDLLKVLAKIGKMLTFKLLFGGDREALTKDSVNYKYLVYNEDTLRYVYAIFEEISEIFSNKIGKLEMYEF